MRMIDKAYQGMAARALVINPILQRVLDYAVTQSITTPTGATLKALNTYCNELETAGILAHTGAGGIPTSASDFTTSDVFVNFAYNDVGLDEFSLIDWIRLTEMTVFGGMTYTVNGWEANAVDGYLDTLYNPSTSSVNYLLDDASRFFVEAKVATGIQSIDCAAPNTNTNWFRSSTTSTIRINQSTSNLNSGIIAGGIGFKAVIRDNSTDVRVLNKDVENSRTATSTSIVNANQEVFRGAGFYSDALLSNYGIAKSLTYTQTQDIRTATNAYLESIGLTQFA